MLTVTHIRPPRVPCCPLQVTLDVDQDYVTDSSRSISGRVSAVYSYGKGVEGTVMLRLSKEAPYWCSDDYYPESAKESPDCQQLVAEVKEAELGAEGSYEFEVPLPRGLNSWGTLELEASVMETATGCWCSSLSLCLYVSICLPVCVCLSVSLSVCLSPHPLIPFPRTPRRSISLSFL